MRNHGTSPHAKPHTYEAMAADVLHFFDTHKLSNVSLLGHSMYVPMHVSIANKHIYASQGREGCDDSRSLA